MSTRNAVWSAALVSLALVSCGPGAGAADAGNTLPGEDAPPTAVLAIDEYTALKGMAQVFVGATDDRKVAKVALVVNGAEVASANEPTNGNWIVSWNTAAGADGLLPVVARVTDSAGQATDSKPVRLIVVNTGTEAELIDGDTNTVSVPANYDPATFTGEIDVKNHWLNPAGIKKIVAVATFTTPTKPFLLGLSVGSGECPDSGATIGGETTGTAGPLVVETDVPSPKTGLHFVHMRPDQPADHKGESVPYTLRVYLF